MEMEMFFMDWDLHKLMDNDRDLICVCGLVLNEAGCGLCTASAVA